MEAAGQCPQKHALRSRPSSAPAGRSAVPVPSAPSCLSSSSDSDASLGARLRSSSAMSHGRNQPEWLGVTGKGIGGSTSWTAAAPKVDNITIGELTHTSTPSRGDSSMWKTSPKRLSGSSSTYWTSHGSGTGRYGASGSCYSSASNSSLNDAGAYVDTMSVEGIRRMRRPMSASGAKELRVFGFRQFHEFGACGPVARGDRAAVQSPVNRGATRGGPQHGWRQK